MGTMGDPNKSLQTRPIISQKHGRQPMIGRGKKRYSSWSRYSVY